MPIDPSIPLQVRNEPIDPLQQLGKYLTLKDMMGQQQERKQRLKTGDLQQQLVALELGGRKIQRAAQAANGVLAVDPTQRNAVYQNTLKELQAEGILTPEILFKMPQQYDANAEAMLRNFSERAKETDQQVKLAIAQLQNEIRMQQLAINQYKAETARDNADTAARRVAAYEESIDNLKAYRADQLQLAKDRLLQQIDREANLSDDRKETLRIRLRAVEGGLAARGREEAGRESRFVRGEAGKMERLTKAETGKTTRQQTYLAKGYSQATVAKNFAAAEAAAKRLPGWDSMTEEEQYETINTLFDSFMSQQAPVVAPATGAGKGLRSVIPGMQPTIPKVTPQPLPTPTGAPPQAAPPAIPAPPGGEKRIRVKRKSDGAPGTILERDFDPAKYERISG